MGVYALKIRRMPAAVKRAGCAVISLRLSYKSYTKIRVPQSHTGGEFQKNRGDKKAR